MAEIGTFTAAVGAIRAALNGLKELKELGLSARHSEAVDAAMCHNGASDHPSFWAELKLSKQ